MPKRPRVPRTGWVGKAVDLVSMIFAANPKLAIAFSGVLTMALTGAVSTFTANATNTAKREKALMSRDSLRAARDLKMDSVLTLSREMAPILKRLDSTQSRTWDTVRVLNAATNYQPWARPAKVRYLREEAKAKALLGITALPAPAAPVSVAPPATTDTRNYVSIQPQPRRMQ